MEPGESIRVVGSGDIGKKKLVIEKLDEVRPTFLGGLHFISNAFHKSYSGKPGQMVVIFYIQCPVT